MNCDHCDLVPSPQSNWYDTWAPEGSVEKVVQAIATLRNHWVGALGWPGTSGGLPQALTSTATSAMSRTGRNLLDFMLPPFI
jgi:hypothetical protein